MNANIPRKPGRTRETWGRDGFDETDWVEWDHWQTVEEMQNFQDGLNDRPDVAEFSDPTDGNGQVARQIRRFGLQADG